MLLPYVLLNCISFQHIYTESNWAILGIVNRLVLNFFLLRSMSVVEPIKTESMLDCMDSLVMAVQYEAEQLRFLLGGIL